MQIAVIAPCTTHVPYSTVIAFLTQTNLQTCFWNNEILTPIQKYGMLGPGQVAFKKLKILLDRMMLRRTKVGILANF